MKKRILLMIIGCSMMLAACGTANSGDIASDSVDTQITSQDDFAGDADLTVTTDEDNEVDEDSNTSTDSSNIENANTEDGSLDGEDAQLEVSIADIYAEIESTVTLVSPMQPSEEFIFNYYGIDTSNLAEYVFEISEEATSAETVIIMKASDSADVVSLQDSLTMVLDDKAFEMQDYLPEQYDIVVESQVKTSGDYVWLVISESANEINSIISKYL